MPSCELCGKDYELKPGRGANNRVTCYECTDSPADRSLHSRNKLLKRNYGITQFQFSQLWEKQGGKCVTCGTDLSKRGSDLKATKEVRKDDPYVDHCHTTGKVRGLLCFHCNTALGHIFDNTEILQSMIKYLSDGNQAHL